MTRQRDTADYNERREQIMEGALRAFAEHGFAKATNRDIADAAGIGSPGLIYHYFAGKEDLLHQLVAARAPLVALGNDLEHFFDLPPAAALRLFAQTLLAVCDRPELIAFYRMLLGEGMRRADVRELINTVGPGRWLPVLAAYLEQQMERGVLRRVDSRAAALSFVGTLMVYIVTHELLHTPAVAGLPVETLQETAIDIFLQGMQPTPPTLGSERSTP